MSETLIEDIKRYQALNGLSDGKLAKAIGIDPGLWSKIKNGKASPGGKFLRGIMKAFPELRLTVMKYMEN